MWVYIRSESEDILGVIITAVVVIGVAIAAIIFGYQQAEASTQFTIMFWSAFVVFSSIAAIAYALLKRIIPRKISAVIALLLVPAAYLTLEVIGNGGLGINMKKYWGFGPKEFYLKSGLFPSERYARSVASCEESRRLGKMKPPFEYFREHIESCEVYVTIDNAGG
ncbi:hypothetical protein [Microvirga sp. Mcv34]|uniref:hypothetical protein n=1 Tax=Microvirga sp. Mcv34 TaxID=2926016 RepID=UPI0021C79C5B|nr:hypothetical protein [Microvirga sp. Mcv34]